MTEPAPAPPGDPAAAARSEGEKASHALFLRGSAWTMIDYGGQQVLRLASNLALWRLVPAEAFGLMGLVNVVIQGLYMFSDVGIGPSIVQNERGDDPDYLNTAWTIQTIRGTLLMLVACALAIPAARFYQQPMLAPLLLLVASTPFLQGFTSTNVHAASRQLALRRLSLVDLSTNVVGTVSMLIAALLTHSVWAMAASGVLATIYRLVLSHKVMPGIRNRFRWDKTAVKTLTHFGRWVFLSTLLTFMAINSDRLIFGKLITIDEFGVYSGVAITWALLPSSVIARVFGTVVFPLLSRARNLGEAVGPVFHDTRSKVLVLAAWLTSCLIAGGEPLIRFLYGGRTPDAGWIIPFLAAGSWFASLENSNSNAALAFGKPKWLAAANAAKVVGMIVLLPVGHHLAGFPGAIVGLAISDVFKYLVSAVAAVHVGIPAWRQDLTLTAGIAAISGAALLVQRLIDARHLPAFLAGTIAFVIVSGGWAAVSWRRLGPLLRRLRRR
jgi:O-antigen/teichoic acid export membrane protein